MSDIEWPAGFDPAPVLRPLRHSAWRQPGAVGAQYRRGVTELSPLRFALTYLGRHLRQQDSGVLSLAAAHLELAAAAQAWPGTGGERDAWVGPRGLGKTKWEFLIKPLWALAHGHRAFFLPFSYTGDQSAAHVATLRQELDVNELLVGDFPELRPRSARGARNSAGVVVLDSGATIMAGGLVKGTMLGRSSGTLRPDLLVGDDLEPGEEDYGPGMKAKLLGKLRKSVLPMASPAAVVSLNGTVTRRDSLMHDVVHTALGRTPSDPWVDALGFRPHYFPPVLADGTSVWPQRWSVQELAAEQRRDPAGYALNYLNDPAESAGRQLWRPEEFRYLQAFPVQHRVLHADVATVAREGRDYTVLVLLGLNAARTEACVEDARWERWTAPQIREQIREMCAPLRIKPLVRIEANQGGETWLDSLAPWPLGVRYEVTYARAPKAVRIAAAHNHYARRAVWHPWPLPELEAALCRYPNDSHDDIPDAVAGALAWAFPRQSVA